MDAQPRVPDGTDTSQVCCADPRVRVLGYLPGGRTPGLDCDSPLRAVCLSCQRVTPWACNSHREDTCVPCSWRYRRRLARIALSGTRDHGWMYLLTLTAPGTTRGHHRRLMDSPGRGEVCGCEESMDSLGEWNATAGARWNVLRTRIKVGLPDLEFLRTVETQKRGALHLHIIVWSSTPVDAASLQRLALSSGFGCEMDLAPIEPGSKKHAYYVGKYVTKATAERYAVPWNPRVVDEETGEITHPGKRATYRSWSQSRGFGVTMKFLKAEARAARERGLLAYRQATEDQTPAESPALEPAALRASSP